MARSKPNAAGPKRPTPIPPGATKEASDRRLPTDEVDDLGDPHAAGTPGGGTSVGGLGGTNLGDGEPDEAELERAFGSSQGDNDQGQDDPSEGYAGPSGGAVGGTPAGKRSVGGKTRRGLSPGQSHRGDSTIGGDPHVNPD